MNLLRYLTSPSRCIERLTGISFPRFVLLNTMQIAPDLILADHLFHAQHYAAATLALLNAIIALGLYTACVYAQRNKITEQ